MAQIIQQARETLLRSRLSQRFPTLFSLPQVQKEERCHPLLVLPAWAGERGHSLSACPLAASPEFQGVLGGGRGHEAHQGKGESGGNPGRLLLFRERSVREAAGPGRTLGRWGQL